MSIGGTAAYRGLTGLPDLVAAAVRRATEVGFDDSCLPAQGRLLAVLAAGRPDGTVAETGTGCGVGLAWMVSAATTGTRFVSVERDPQRAEVARRVFADRPNVTVVRGEHDALAEHGPFDLLVLDGGGAGKAGHPPIDITSWLRPGGTVVIDNFGVCLDWPRLAGVSPGDADSAFVSQ